MDLSASISSRRFKTLPAVGQLLPPAHMADLSEDGEIYDSDDDGDDDDNDDDYKDDGPFSPNQTQALPKPLKQVINLTCDDDDLSKGEDGGLLQVS